MSDDLHAVPGQTGAFEFKLIKPGEGSQDVIFPKNGKYHGWFLMKQPLPSKASVKIDDKDMTITFTKTAEPGAYTVEGTGYNKFGTFTLRGSLAPDGTIHMYRSYTLKPVKKRTVSPTLESKKKRTSIADTTPSSTIAASALTSAVSTPLASAREGAGRVRKRTSFEFEEATTAPAVTAGTPKTPKAAFTPKSANSKVPAATKQHIPPLAPAASATPGSSSGRSQRIPLAIQRCGEILKEMAKQPHAVWFAEPVDPVKLNIPDYLTIIKQPMDFKTVRANLEGNAYTTPEAFAEHMRMVFNNAITYNVARDNLVNIAAREMSNRFEERYRALLAQLAQASAPAFEEAAPVAGRKSVGKQPTERRLSGGAPLARSSSVSSFTSKKGGTLSPRGIGPRGAEIVLPPALDLGAHYVIEMQRRMDEMQSEITKLRTAVRQNEVSQHIVTQREAAHHPLTLEEKKALIQEINLLPDSKQAQVLEIIHSSSSLPPDQDEDVEIPLDQLDTLTLRRLQKYVEDCSASSVRKREHVGSPRADHSPTAQAQKKAKKQPSASTSSAARKSTASASSSTKSPSLPQSFPLMAASLPTPYNTSSGAVDQSVDSKDEMVDDEFHTAASAVDLPETTDLLFGSENFEVLRSNSYEYGSDDGSNMGEQEEDDDGQVNYT